MSRYLVFGSIKIWYLNRDNYEQMEIIAKESNRGIEIVFSSSSYSDEQVEEKDGQQESPLYQVKLHMSQ